MTDKISCQHEGVVRTKLIAEWFGWSSNDAKVCNSSDGSFEAMADQNEATIIFWGSFLETGVWHLQASTPEGSLAVSLCPIHFLAAKVPRYPDP